MKAYIKRVSALALAVVLCLALCSCNAIKEMRASQAFYGENGEIILGGQVYKSLNTQELPAGLETRINDVGYITESDVPVLLASTFGEWASYNHNKTVIEAGIYYAREDVYDYVAQLIKYPYISDYCVEVENEVSYETEYQLLKQRYLNAIDEIVYGGNEITYDQQGEYAFSTDSMSIYKCDEKMVFQSLAYRVEEMENGDILLTRFTEEYDVYIIRYRVPDDKKAIMKELLALG